VEELKREVGKLMNNELIRANKINGYSFHSNHEAYAVILEEIQEAEQELSNLQGQMRFLWEAIKQDDDQVIKLRIEQMKKRSILLIAESIQTAAMIQKLIDTLNK
jgi:hypothetical protein